MVKYEKVKLHRNISLSLFRFVSGIANYGFPYHASFCYACWNLGLLKQNF